MKLKSLAAYNNNDVPDHVRQELIDLAQELTIIIHDSIKNKHPNIVLGAFSYLHSAMIKRYVADKRSELENAARLHAAGLIKNVDFLIEMMEKEQAEQENDV